MFDFGDIFTAAGLVTLGQVILIDLTKAGDNVVIIGTLPSGLPAKDRRRVIMLGVFMALFFLIAFAYNLYRELRPAWSVSADDPETETVEGPPASKTFLRAAIQW